MPTHLTPINAGASRSSAAASKNHAAFFSQFARTVSGLTAHPLTFAFAVLAVLIWAAWGPASHYSETWQLWINTSTTILTFLMVFLLQNAQMRDTKALHVKLDELIRAVHGARDELIDLENLSEEELEQYCTEFSRLHQRYSDAMERRRKKRRPRRPPASDAVGRNGSKHPKSGS